jgi:hypothetical protein
LIMDETQAALRLAQAIDQLCEGKKPDASSVLRAGEGAGTSGEDAALLAVAERLAGLNRAFGPVSPMLEQRVAAMVEAATPHGFVHGYTDRVIRVIRERRAVSLPILRLPRWGLATLAVLVLAIGLLAWPGRSTLARFGGSVSLGPVEVRILAPTETAVGVQQVQVTTAQRRLGSLAEAEAEVGRALLRPTSLPAGYTLSEVTVVYYDAMPRWLGQPLFVDLSYRAEQGLASRLDVRQYFVALGPGRDLHSLRFSDDEVRQVTQVEIGGQPGVLMTLQSPVAGTGTLSSLLTVVVWQQEGLLLELSAPSLTADELLSVARSVGSDEGPTPNDQ